MSRSIKFSPEAVTKALAALGRHNDPAQALEAAESGGNAEQAQILKALYDVVHTTADVTGGTSLFDGLLEIAQRQSLIGKINAIWPFFEVPKNTRILTGDNPQAGFVAEGAPAPILLSDLESITQQPKAVRAIQVLTDDLVRNSRTEHLLSRGLIRAASDAESSAFFSSAAATAAAPAGLLYGITPAPGSADLEADLGLIVEGFNGDLSRSVLATSPKTAIKLGRRFFGAGLNGDVAGLPIVAHNSIGEGQLAIIEPGRVLLTDDGLVIQPSQHATIMAKSGNDADVEVGLWQANLTAFQIIRYITWRPAADSVVWLSGGTW